VSNNLSHAPMAGPSQPGIPGFTRGHVTRGKEKFAFLYGVAAAVTITIVAIYSLVASLTWFQGLMLLAGCLLVIWTLVYSVLEMHSRDREEGSATRLEQPDPYGPRKVVIAPPTGEPYPHHETYAESAGFDQGQLTSRIPGSTPFIDEEKPREEKHQKAVR